MQKFDLTGVSVHIGVPVHGTFQPQTLVSFINTFIELSQRGIPAHLGLQAGTSIVELSRNYVCDNFLNSTCTHLFMIDADQTWSPEDFLRVLALATVMPIVAGAYPAKREPETWLLGANGITEVNEYGCLPVDGLGLGFCCVQRQVIETLGEKVVRLATHDRPGRVRMIFRTDEDHGWFRGEDMAFFADCKANGFPVHIDMQAKIGHMGMKEYKGDFYAAMEAKRVEKPKAYEPRPAVALDQTKDLVTVAL